MARGGKRNGAGRKKIAESSVTIRVPISMKQEIKNWVKRSCLAESQQCQSDGVILSAIQILENALTLKANAGGKIKTEIRQTIALLQSKN
jgi:hypothetical protein